MTLDVIIMTVVIIKNYLNYYQKVSNWSVLFLFFWSFKCQKSYPESLSPLGNSFLLIDSNFALCESKNCCK